MDDIAPRASGETYFFRDHGQFDLLRLRLLPELIERRRGERTLRLWSAGCASGEEAYSLAMLVDMLLPHHDCWNLFILGSDIDSAALAKARRAHYGQWSFRMAPSALQQRYFRRKGDEWVLDDGIRRMVSFRRVDLIGDACRGGDFCNMDLILCRNVFIYFRAGMVSVVADKLAATLSEGGYLMTAHTELMGYPMPNMRSRLFADGVVYQRESPPPAENPASARIAPLAAAPVAVAVPAARMLPLAMPCADDMLLAAREFADRGEYGNAEQSCRRALTMAPLAAGPYFLLAQLAQLRGDFARAMQLLDKTLYLDPGNVAAYLEQAALYERNENLPRAQMLRCAALDLLRALPGDAVIEPYETSAAELALWLAQ